MSRADGRVLHDAALQDATLRTAALPDAALQDATLRTAALPDAAVQDATLRTSAGPCTAPQGAAPLSRTVRAASPRPLRLKKRAGFLAVAKGARIHRDAFTLQALRRASDARIGPLPRVGFTVTKKTGNAVARNRIRRRLRALSDRLAGEFAASTDYVIVARAAAFDAPFESLGADLAAALGAVRRKLDRPAAADRPARQARPPSPSPSHRPDRSERTANKRA